MTVWSTFGRRLVALPGAGSFLTTLGVSAFIQTLLDDADAATARTTLGAVGLTGNETVAGIKTFSSNPVVSGGGIQFPATQVPSADANALDDYEEGTFTPTVSGTATAGEGTYSSQVGTYTKIGRMVMFNATLVWSAHTGTGNMILTGLPFTIVAGGSMSFRVTSLTFPATLIQGFFAGGGTSVTIETVATGAGAAALAIDTAAGMQLSGVYQTS
jgi:hypothetical protein